MGSGNGIAEALASFASTPIYGTVSKTHCVNNAVCIGTVGELSLKNQGRLGKDWN
ncbi:hypothetical protein RMSM_04432, partial [Rhodopirellula maiorica SM1]